MPSDSSDSPPNDSRASGPPVGPAHPTPDVTRAHIDFEALPNLLNPRHKLKLTGVALGIIRLGPGEGYTFTHQHREQEEVYMVIEGSGQILLDGQVQPLVRGDFVRVGPTVRRALHGGTEGLIAICAGGVPAGYPRRAESRYLIDDGIPDYEDLPPWCADDPDARERNRKLAERMARSRARRQG